MALAKKSSGSYNSDFNKLAEQPPAELAAQTTSATIGAHSGPVGDMHALLESNFGTSSDGSSLIVYQPKHSTIHSIERLVSMWCGIAVFVAAVVGIGSLIF